MLSVFEKRTILTRMWLSGDAARTIGDAIGMSQHQVCVMRRRFALPKRSLEQRLANTQKHPNWAQEMQARRDAVAGRKKFLEFNRAEKLLAKGRLLDERNRAFEAKRTLFLELVGEDTPIRDAALASGIPVKRAMRWMTSKRFD